MPTRFSPTKAENSLAGGPSNLPGALGSWTGAPSDLRWDMTRIERNMNRCDPSPSSTIPSLAGGGTCKHFVPGPFSDGALLIDL